MSATADVSAGDASGPSELQAALTNARVVRELDAAAIAEIGAKLADPKYSDRNKLIANGREAKPGINGFFEPAFHVGIQPGHLADNGTMNFFDRELLKPMAAEEFIGTLHQPIPGVAGVRVDGSEIKVAAVYPSKLRLGPGVRSGADGRIYAARAGVLLYAAEQSVDIAQQHVHQGDVDMRSGNLDMKGNLAVRGTVQRMFTVRATGELEIQGGVESGSVYGSASVHILGAVRGGDSGVVCAEGDLTIHHAETAHIRCGRGLKIESAVHCDLAAVNIQIARVMRGGSAAAETSLVVQEAGGTHGRTGTLIAAAVPLERPFGAVQRALAEAREQRTQQHRAGGLRGEGERGKGGKAGRANATLEREELERRAALAQRRNELLATAQVLVIGRAHPGVTVQIGAKSLLIEQTTATTRFSFDPKKREIRVEKGGK